MSKINYMHDALEQVQDVLNNADISVVWHDKDSHTHLYDRGTILVDGEPTELGIHHHDSGEWELVCRAFHNHNGRVTKHTYTVLSTLEDSDTLAFIDKLEMILLAGLAPYA